jgi:hypothetical protein
MNILMKEPFPILDTLNSAGAMLMHLNVFFTTCGEAEKFKLMKLIFPESLEFYGKQFLASAMHPALAFKYKKDLFDSLLTLKEFADESKSEISQDR